MNTYPLRRIFCTTGWFRVCKNWVIFSIYLYWNLLVLASSATYVVNDRFEINNGILFILRISSTEIN